MSRDEYRITLNETYTFIGYVPLVEVTNLRNGGEVSFVVSDLEAAEALVERLREALSDKYILAAVEVRRINDENRC